MQQQQDKNETKKDHILGGLWGSVLGDVIGAFLQFDKDVTKEKIVKAFTINGGGKHFLEPGQPTDDSELNYAVCRGLIRGKGDLNLNYIAQEMGNWFLSKPIDVGNTIRNSVPKACNMKIHQAHLCRKGARQRSQGSQSNGTLMALIGLAIWCHNLSSIQLIQAVKQFTILIHPNQLVVLTNCAYSLMIKYYLTQTKKESQNQLQPFVQMKSTLNQNKLMFDAKCFEQFQIWLKTIQSSFQNIQILEKQVPITKNAGWVRVAFSYAIYFTIKENNFKKAIQYLISAKGDTDTNACIVGGLLGVKLGLSKMKDMTDQIYKINKWRPNKKKRPDWMVPGLVIQKITDFLYQQSPTSLKLIGSDNNNVTKIIKK